MQIVQAAPSEVELFDPAEPASLVRGRAQEDARLEHEGSVRRVRLGKRLQRIFEEELWRLYGYRSFNEWVRAAQAAGELPFGVRQARSYRRLAGLALAPLWGTNYSMTRLLALAKAAPAPEARPRPAPKPSHLAEQASTCLRQLQRLTQRLGPGVLGAGAEHGYLRRLDEGVRDFVLSYLDARGLSSEALLGERRERPRDGEGAAETAEEAGSGSALPMPEKAPDPEMLDPSGGVGAGAGAAPDVPWHEPVVAAVLAVLRPGEAQELERHLLLALSGRPPGELLGLVRAAGRRLLPGPLRDDLGCWLRQAGQRDLEARWPYLYMFLTAAQLPRFRWHLDLLRAVELPASVREILEAAWAYWPLREVEGPVEERAAARLAAFIESRQAASVEPLAWAYVEAAELRDALASARP